jgi:endonuclease-3
MVAAPRKTVDKPDVCKHVLALLKKTYSTAALKQDLPVLEIMLYAVCLEDSPLEQADQVYAKIHNGFHDLNEVRVSSVYELEGLFRELPNPEWRALRVRNILQYVFEATYGFDFEPFRRKTLELAQKQLGKIKSLSPFVKAFVLQQALDSHVLPVDHRLLQMLQWLGLAELNATPEHAGEALRSAVRKADAPLFCYLLRCLRDDPRLTKALSRGVTAPSGGSDEADGYARLTALFKGGAKAHAKPESKPDAARKKPAAKGAARPAAGKSSSQATKKKRK